MAIGYTFTSKVTATNICTNNNTRDLKYEAYCDSIWNANPDYYLDIITETNVDYILSQLMNQQES